MAEAEAQNGIFAADSITTAWYAAKGMTALPYPPLSPGSDARYDIDEVFALGDVRPMIAKPYSPGNAVPAEEVARERIGFDGWLMSDDLGMEALQGDFAGRAAGVVAAGCDVALHCSGKMDEMVAVASAVPPMSSEGHERLARAMAITRLDLDHVDFAEEIAKRDQLLALA